MVRWQDVKRAEVEGRAKDGCAQAQAELALMLMYRLDGGHDAARVHELLEAAAAADVALAYALRAENRFFGENGYSADAAAAAVDAERAVALGDAWMGATILGWTLESSDSDRARSLFETSLEAMRPGLAEEDAVTEDWYAWRFCNGQGVPKDVPEGMRWFHRSAEHGLSWAMLWLGLRYTHADGVEKDLEKGKFWLTRAASEFSIPEAIAALATLAQDSH